MADDAIHWMRQLNDIDPSMPFMVYYVPSGTHAPHYPTPEWVEKISDLHLFDKGWNALRDTIFANQQKLFIRQANVYAAYLAYTDHEIGRVVQAVQDMGKLDNTLIIYISGDNGASAEGTQNGTPSEMLSFNGIELSAEAQMKFYDAWGSEY
jgi:arylsulfatase